MDAVQWISFGVGLAILASVFLLMRSGRLRERYSLLWVLSGGVICALAVFRRLLEEVSYFLGIHYPPSLLFLVGVLFLLAINISFSVRISELNRKVTFLAQEIALLRARGGEPPPPAPKA